MKSKFEYHSCAIHMTELRCNVHEVNASLIEDIAQSVSRRLSRTRRSRISICGVVCVSLDGSFGSVTEKEGYLEQPQLQSVTTAVFERNLHLITGRKTVNTIIESFSRCQWKRLRLEDDVYISPSFENITPLHISFAAYRCQDPQISSGHNSDGSGLVPSSDGFWARIVR